MIMIPWDGIGCYFSGIALYYLGITICKDAEILKSVTRVNRLKELEKLLDTQNSPLVVAISGRVASESTIECELSGLKCVIVEEAVEQHFLKHKHNDSWIKDSALTSFTSKEVPWYLEDTTDRVDVVGAQSAKDFVLPVKHEVFKPSNPRLISKALHYIRGLKELGFNRTERTLPIGTTLTVVGEVAKDDAGTVRIQQPRTGPFYVSPKTIDQLIIANHGNLSRWFKYASIGLAIVGSCLIANRTIQYILLRRQQCKLLKRVLDAAAKKSKQGIEGEMDDNLSAGGQGDLPDLCVICLDEKYNAAFLPCGHMCCCTTCSSRLKICPLCRGRINQVAKIFRNEL